MPQYRKKPIVIDAFQWDGQGLQPELPQWFYQCMQVPGSVMFGYDGSTGIHSLKIHTLEGDMQVTPGDFIIKGLRGEIYPCKPDIFEATYERVSE